MNLVSASLQEISTVLWLVVSEVIVVNEVAVVVTVVEMMHSLEKKEDSSS